MGGRREGEEGNSENGGREQKRNRETREWLVKYTY